MFEITISFRFKEEQFRHRLSTIVVHRSGKQLFPLTETNINILDSHLHIPTAIQCYNILHINSIGASVD
jgi:hypothetical protein